MRSIETAYSLGSTTGNANTFGVANWNYGKNNAFGVGSAFTKMDSQSYRDKRIQDALTIFQRDIENNICETPTDGVKGYAVCSIAGSKKNITTIWMLPSVLMVGVPILLGFPAASHNVEFDVDITIYDRNKNIVKKYSALGSDKEYAALYWGYTPAGEGFLKDTDHDVCRTACAKALLKALTEIKGQIQNDTSFLIKKLSEQ